jgi:MOSC domain-containing protein YiiM
MGRTGAVLAVCISTAKGTPKAPVAEGRLLEGHGLEGDAHAGTEREVSLLCRASADKVRTKELDPGPGDFAENLLVDGLAAEDFTLGARIRLTTDGEEALLEVTQIGKECHADCAIRRLTGDCVMPREGIFAHVLEGGPVRPGTLLELTEGQ